MRRKDNFGIQLALILNALLLNGSSSGDSIFVLIHFSDSIIRKIEIWEIQGKQNINKYSWDPANDLSKQCWSEENLQQSIVQINK